MMKQLYKDSLNDIEVSKSLICKTKFLMRQKRDSMSKRTMIVRYTSMAICFVIIFLVVAAPKLMNRFSSGNNTSSLAPPMSTPSGQQPYTSVSDSDIYINRFGDMIEQPPMRSGPAIDRVEKWTFEQYCDLIGFDPLPTAIPEGFNLIESDTKNISFNNDKRIDFYNTWSFVYTNGSEENEKYITVNINPSSIPYWSVPRAYQLQGHVQITDITELLNFGQKSNINGTNVTIWYKDKGSLWNYIGGDVLGEIINVSDYYCADFQYKGTGFTITAQNGITQDEFIQILGSIIK